MINEAVFFSLFWLFIKHFICDFPLQTFSWMYKNKGTYGHFGGVSHAALHGLGTFAALAYWLGPQAWTLAVIDMVVHYHIDWAKMNINKKFNLRADNSEWFWISLGTDQLLHHITYFTLVAIAFKVHL